MGTVEDENRKPQRFRFHKDDELLLLNIVLDTKPCPYKISARDGTILLAWNNIAEAFKSRCAPRADGMLPHSRTCKNRCDKMIADYLVVWTTPSLRDISRESKEDRIKFDLVARLAIEAGKITNTSTNPPNEDGSSTSTPSTATKRHAAAGTSTTGSLMNLAPRPSEVSTPVSSESSSNAGIASALGSNSANASSSSSSVVSPPNNGHNAFAFHSTTATTSMGTSMNPISISEQHYQNLHQQYPPASSSPAVATATDNNTTTVINTSQASLQARTGGVEELLAAVAENYTHGRPTWTQNGTGGFSHVSSMSTPALSAIPETHLNHNANNITASATTSTNINVINKNRGVSARQTRIRATGGGITMPAEPIVPTGSRSAKRTPRGIVGNRDPSSNGRNDEEEEDDIRSSKRHRPSVGGKLPMASAPRHATHRNQPNSDHNNSSTKHPSSRQTRSTKAAPPPPPAPPQPESEEEEDDIEADEDDEDEEDEIDDEGEQHGADHSTDQRSAKDDINGFGDQSYEHDYGNEYENDYGNEYGGGGGGGQSAELNERNHRDLAFQAILGRDLSSRREGRVTTEAGSSSSSSHQYRQSSNSSQQQQQQQQQHSQQHKRPLEMQKNRGKSSGWSSSLSTSNGHGGGSSLGGLLGSSNGGQILIPSQLTPSDRDYLLRNLALEEQRAHVELEKIALEREKLALERTRLQWEMRKANLH
ncbi:hypothetical protein BGZ83_012044 [Gryganskiella cystojenkinii]|nr:hypothetical protein BGZ83_012044 [Gryganskiella cystojenkinii]